MCGVLDILTCQCQWEPLGAHSSLDVNIVLMRRLSTWCAPSILTLTPDGRACAICGCLLWPCKLLRIVRMEKGSSESLPEAKAISEGAVSHIDCHEPVSKMPFPKVVRIRIGRMELGFQTPNTHDPASA